MKQIVTYLSIFGAGCALGVLGTKTYFAKKYKDISDAEIESVKEVYKRKTIALEGSERKDEIKIVSEPKKEGVGSGLFVNLTPEHMKDMQIKYNAASSDILAESESPIEGDYKPYFVDIDDFDAVNDGFAKQQFVYYMDDGTLADASLEGTTTQTDIEEEVINPSDTVGIDNLELFENMEDEVCYIRNESLKTDYEVTKVYSSYSQVVGDDY